MVSNTMRTNVDFPQTLNRSKRIECCYGHAQRPAKSKVKLSTDMPCVQSMCFIVSQHCKYRFEDCLNFLEIAACLRSITWQAYFRAPRPCQGIKFLLPRRGTSIGLSRSQFVHMPAQWNGKGQKIWQTSISYPTKLPKDLEMSNIKPSGREVIPRYSKC